LHSEDTTVSEFAAIGNLSRFTMNLKVHSNHRQQLLHSFNRCVFWMQPYYIYQQINGKNWAGSTGKSDG